jgi:RNA polymerase sigma factor (sigma-70 family)
MAKDRRGTSLRHIHTLFNVGTIGRLSDGELLKWYTTRGGEPAELAFSALVERHGPMVLRVCRSLLRDEHAAHDAFQATFLVLVRRAARLWVQDSLGPWLHQVACRVAACARSAEARRRRHERRAAELAAHPRGDEAWDDLRPILHEEIGRLPVHYRAVIVLCCLEGMTQEQAARQLGWPLGTVQSRLARGRERLRGRLTRRGLPLLVGPFCSAMTRERAEAVPAALIDETTRAAGAIALAAGGASTAGVVSAAASGLMEGALRTMFLIQLKRIAAIILVVGMATAGAGVLARQPAKDAPASPPRELMKTLMPSYVVDPPDMITVEVLEAIPGRPISGERLVRPDGKITLNWYGEVYVAGLTPLEIKEKVILHLRKYLSDEQLGLVMPDPERPGRSRAVSAIDSTRVYVNVEAYNSKNYYVLGEVAAPGRFPITGNETVLDAINFAGGLMATASKSNLRLVRPPVPGVSSQQVLRVDYSAIAYEGDPTTNFQLRPGDRLIVVRDPNAGAADEKPEPSPTAAEPRTPRAEAPPDGPESTPTTTDLRALERRLNAMERKLDRVIELLGGPSNPPPAPRTDRPTALPREER